MVGHEINPEISTRLWREMPFLEESPKGDSSTCEQRPGVWVWQSFAMEGTGLLGHTPQFCRRWTTENFGNFQPGTALN